MARSEHAGVERRLARAVPGTRVKVKKPLGLGAAGLGDRVQRIEKAGLVAARVVPVGAPGKTRGGERQTLAGDGPQRLTGDRRRKGEPGNLGAQPLAALGR